MAKNLIIVESPTKTKTIAKVLGRNYKVMASKGHLRDLPKSQFGVDIENNFEPKYINVRGKAPTINALKKEAKKADMVYLATDPDREGEAISWHLSYLLGLDPKAENRVSFQEITASGVKEGMKKPRSIDLDLVDAQQARRIMDRIVGYEISPILWKRVKSGLSAGRVQSVALKLIVDRQKEIDAFIPEEYWTLHAQFEKEGMTFQADFYKKKGDRKKTTIPNLEEAEKILKDLNEEFLVAKVEKKNRSRRPFPPFTTSTLQQEASKRLGFSTSKTMMIAQRLYEGIDLGKEGQVGLITYMRTDSTRLSDEFIKDAKNYIAESMGSDYVSASTSRKKSKQSQDAHEAIRPSSIRRLPNSMKAYLSNDEYKLYDLIWRRAIASLMKSARFLSTTISLENNQYEFRANGIQPKFPGYQKIWEVKDNTVILPELVRGEEIKCQKMNKVQHFTQPPARYTEASLVKTLEENGIGRPSTYSTTIKSILNRNYVKLENKAFEPTDLGFTVHDFLEKNFSDIINIAFTARMEDQLDEIASGNLSWRDLLADFYEIFSKDLERTKKDNTSYKVEAKPIGRKCPKCGKDLLLRQGRNGEFIGCSGFPSCDYTESIVVKVGVACPRDGGDLIEKISKKGRIFYACSNYPACDYATWDKPTGEVCELCNDLMVRRKNRKEDIVYCHNEECPNHKI